MTARQTKPKTSPMKDQNEMNPYAPHPELLAAITALAAALDGREKIDAAMIRNTDALAEAEAAQADRTAAIEKLEVELALETGEQRAQNLEDAAEDARGAADEAARTTARLTRIGGALQAKAIDADAAIAEARTVLDREKQVFTAACMTALDADLVHAAATLRPVLAKAAALREMGLISFQEPLLADMDIPAAVSGLPAVMRGTVIRTAEAGLLDLTVAWRTDADPALVELVNGPLSTVQRRAAAHRNYAPPPKTGAASNYEPNAQNLSAAAANREIEAREAARLAANPPKRWEGRSWQGAI